MSSVPLAQLVRRPPRAARLLLLAVLLSTVSIIGIEQVHDGQAHAAGTTVAAGQAADGGQGHAADGGHGATTPEAGHGTSATGVARVGGAVFALHWVRDTALALPVVLVGLLLAAAAVRRLPARRRRSVEVVLVARAVLVAGALAVASPAHALLFAEGDTSLTGVLRVLVLTLPLTFGTLMVVAAASGAAQLRRDPARGVPQVALP